MVLAATSAFDGPLASQEASQRTYVPKLNFRGDKTQKISKIYIRMTISPFLEQKERNTQIYFFVF